MSSSKRHFTAVIDSNEYGIYVSSTPSSAAKKVVSKLCANNKNKKVKFSIRETTQKSRKKTYGPYIGYMEKLDKPVELEGRVIKYKPVAKLDKKSSKMIGGNLSDGQNVGRLSSLQSLEFTNLAGGGPGIPFVGGIFSRIKRYAEEEGKKIVKKDVEAFAEEYASTRKTKWYYFEQKDLEQALKYYVDNVYEEPQQTQDHTRAGPARNPNNLFSQFMKAARKEKIASEQDIISFAKWYINESQSVTREVAENPRQENIDEMLQYFKKQFSRNQGHRPSEPEINHFFRGIVRRITDAAEKAGVKIVFEHVVAFAEEYASRMPQKSSDFSQKDLEEALDIYINERYKDPGETQDPTRAGPARNTNNLFSQFRIAARQQQIASEEDINSFAEWYINERQIVTREVAENPRQQDIDEMLRYFKEEIRKRAERRVEWDLYKELFDSTTGSLSLGYVNAHLENCNSVIRAAFGGNLPRDGEHVIPNAYIFRISPRLNFDRIWSFLSATEQKGFPCFVYRSQDGRYRFDKKGVTSSVSDGQVCCMFLDAVGWRDTKYDPRVVKLSDFQHRNSGRSNEALESGAAISSGDYLEGKVHSGQVRREMVKINPASLTKPFPGLNDFMLRQGAFALILSII